MAYRQFPILMWNLPNGGQAAALLGDLEPAASVGRTRDQAYGELKELIEWRLEHQPWNAEPDLSKELRLFEVKVDVRPRYASRRRVVPCPDTLRVSVPCVTGVQESGIGFCVAPHLGIQFNYHEHAALKDLVTHYAKEALQGLSPAELLLRRPPAVADCRLETMIVHVPSDRIRRVPPEERPALKMLFTVADPVLLDRGRKRGASAAYGREALAEAVASKLELKRLNLLLVGEPGCGKSTLLREAIKRMLRRPVAADAARRAGGGDDEATDGLGRYQHWRSSGSRLIAGMRFLGEWEERCEEFIRQLGAVGGVFCAESLLELVSVGGRGPGDSVGAFLLPYLQRGELRMVGEATPAELEACRRLLPGLLDAFEIVPVPAFNDHEALRVIETIAESLAATIRMEMEPGTIALVHHLFRRFQPYSVFPGPAAGFVRQLCSASSPAPARRTVLTRSDVVRAFGQRTGLPELFLRDDLPLLVEELRARLAQKIIGQPEAIAVAARLMATIKAGLTDPGRPSGVLFFCGPTGVGKTALARLLADECFGAGGTGGEDRLVRLDMSEYAGWGAATRLLQNPQGRAAPWIERVRRQPFCVVLLDEIEKAASEVFDVLLSLLDEGRLTDRFGGVTWFRSAIVILTSNLGARITGAAGFGPAAEVGYANAVSQFFRPEFFNRLDAVIAFHALDRGAVERIARKELEELAAREGLAAAGLKLQWSERVVAAVADAGYDHRLGARPLQRAMERLVVTPLARWKVEHPTARGRTLRVDYDAGRVTVTAEMLPAGEPS